MLRFSETVLQFSIDAVRTDVRELAYEVVDRLGRGADHVNYDRVTGSAAVVRCKGGSEVRVFGNVGSRVLRVTVSTPYRDVPLDVRGFVELAREVSGLKPIKGSNVLHRWLVAGVKALTDIELPWSANAVKVIRGALRGAGIAVREVLTESVGDSWILSSSGAYHVGGAGLVTASVIALISYARVKELATSLTKKLVFTDSPTEALANSMIGGAVGLTENIAHLVAR